MSKIKKQDLNEKGGFNFKRKAEDVFASYLKKEMAKKMSKSDKKTWHKTTQKLGKITDGGGRPYSKEEIFKFLKGETRVNREAKIKYEHDN